MVRGDGEPGDVSHDRPPPRHRRDEGHPSKTPTAKQTLGTCAACARRTAGYIENTKAIFSGDSEKVTVRPVDSPSRGASTSSSFDGGFNNLLGGRRSSARRGGPERLLVDGATLNKFFVALLQGFIRLE